MQRLPVILAFFGALTLAACGGGRSIPNPPTPAFPTAPPIRASTIVVTDTCNQSIETFPATATGLSVATTEVRGKQTGLNDPIYDAIDKSGDFWVSDFSAVALLEYPSTTNGNIPASNTVDAAAFDSPTGIAFDANDRAYVADIGTNSIYVFAAGATGAATPIQTIVGAATTLNNPEQVAIDQQGNIWVANFSNNSVLEFAGTANGNVAPIKTIVGAATGLDDPDGIYVDSSGTIWVANQLGNSIDAFASGSSGNVAPSKTIAGASTDLSVPISLAGDPAGYIYVAEYGLTSQGSIQVFAPGANGNVAPAQNITQAGTACPAGVAVR